MPIEHHAHRGMGRPRRRFRPWDFIAMRVLRVARLTAFVVTVGAVVLGVEIASVRASVGEGALAAASILGSLADLSHEVTSLTLNGERTFASATLLDEPLGPALDRIEAHCKGAPTELPAPHALGATASLLDAALRVRSERGDDAMIACVVPTEPRAHSPALDRVRAVADTGDLGQLGSLQLFVAHRQGARTQVIATWTAPSFRLDRAFPSAGDAPGTDLADVPRLASSRRLLTANADGHPFGLRIYDVRLAPEEVLREYDARMGAMGWDPHPGVAARREELRAFSRGDRDVFFAVRAFRGGSIVSVTDSAGRAHRLAR